MSLKSSASLIGVVAAVIAAPALAAAPKPDWTRLADCAAYQQVSEKVGGGPASSEAAYVEAAQNRFRAQRPSNADKAEKEVADRVALRAKAVAKSDRPSIDRLIKSCPEASA